jgi:protein-L-isoaspartate(D-aspartate) O-methyltransferase
MLTPTIEARILETIAIKQHERVLEIGTGSGYMAALLAHRARFVTTVEIEPVLKELAKKNLADYALAIHSTPKSWTSPSPSRPSSWAW